MSRNRNRNRNTITLDRRDLARVVDEAIARRYTPPAGANITPIPQNIIDTMMQQQAPQSKTGGMWEPGAPIQPVPGLAPPQGPRQWSYQYGYNIGQLPRATELTAFETLRNLSKLYEIIPMCEQVWYDLAGKLELEIRVRPKHAVDEYGEPIDPKTLADTYGDRIKRWDDFFAMPDPDNEQELHPWMQMLLKERLEIDAIALYKRRDRVGRLYGLEPFDGATLKPLLNERGRKPNGDFPAYEQFIHGTPAMFLRRDEVIYNRETEQVNSPYGFSRVEYIILRVNQALRKENKDLAYFTDGNVPAGMLELPDDGTTDWTPEQMLLYQEMWDGMLAGNESIKARLKVIPPGAKYNKTDLDDILTIFDDFVMTVTCGAFGVPKTELSFTEKSNRSTGETQEAVIYRRPLATIRKLFSGIFNKVMAEEGDGKLEATWKGYEEPEDFKVKAEAEDILVKNGTMSTSQGARWLGIKPMVETEPMIVVPGQGITFISDANDMREEAKAAKLAGYQQQKDGLNEQGTQQGAAGKTGAMGGKQGQGGGAAKAGGKSTSQSSSNGSGNASNAAKRSIDGTVSGEPGDAERAAISAELRRWRDVAVKYLEAGRPFREFASDLIPYNDKRYIQSSLNACSNRGEIHAIFKNFLDRVKQAQPQDAEIIGAQPRLEYNVTLDIWEATDTEDQLEALRAQGDTIEWEAHVSETGICPTCKPNDGIRRTIGEQFPSGHRIPQVHGNCQCSVRVVSSLGAITGGGAK